MHILFNVNNPPSIQHLCFENEIRLEEAIFIISRHRLSTFYTMIRSAAGGKFQRIGFRSSGNNMTLTIGVRWFLRA